MSDSLRVVILGNVSPEAWWSTEWEYAGAWSNNDHDVSGYMEQNPAAWDELIADVAKHSFDLVQWTSTRQFADAAGEARQWELAAACRRAGVPLIGIHLDQFLSLPERVERVKTSPYFRAVDVMFTVDGGHDDLWRDLGINHRHLLPAISERWLGPGEPKDKWRSDIAFVGSWQGHYHPEFAHRHELVERLARKYGKRIKFWPERGQHRIVGTDLNDLYWSTRVVIGDAFHEPGSGGSPLRATGSDRSPETLGRGGLLITPAVEGWNAAPPDPFYGPGCWTWPMWDWAALDAAIEEALSMEGVDVTLEREAAINFIAPRHTYTQRVREVVSTLQVEGMI